MQKKIASIIGSAVGVSALIAAFIATTALPTSANPPDRQPVGNVSVTLPAGPTTCPFDLREDFLADREKLTTFFDRDGNVVRLQVTGQLVARFTNLSTGASITLHISGPATLTFGQDGTLTANGRGTGTGLPLTTGAALIHGNVTIVVGPDGTGTIQELHGNMQSLCALVT